MIKSVFTAIIMMTPITVAAVMSYCSVVLTSVTVLQGVRVC